MSSIKNIARYAVIGAFVVVAMLGIPLVFPSKSNPYSGKSTGDKSALEMKG